MKIMGLQKVSLVDYPARVAATVFLGGCNLACPFCHNPLLVLPEQDREISLISGRPEQDQKINLTPKQLGQGQENNREQNNLRTQTRLDPQEVLQYLEKRKGVLGGVCITGGEPLLQPDLEEFIQKIRALGYNIKLDTNGCFPLRLKNLLKKGLVDYVAMDIKAPPKKYAAATGQKDFDIATVEKSINVLKEWGGEFEFRTTLVKEFHSPVALDAMGRWLAPLAKPQTYYLQQFVDENPLINDATASCKTLTPLSNAEMLLAKEILSPFFPHIVIRGI